MGEAVAQNMAQHLAGFVLFLVEVHNPVITLDNFRQLLEDIHDPSHGRRAVLHQCIGNKLANNIANQFYLSYYRRIEVDSLVYVNCRYHHSY
jgi:hypothetical protein